MPQLNGGFLTVAKTGSNDVRTLRELCGEILELTLPQRIRDLGMYSDPQIAQQVRETLAMHSRPSIIVARGRFSNGKIQYILFCPQGVPPESALQTAQQVAQDKLTDLIALSN